MLERLHSKKGLQLLIALIAGFLFGFLLQKGGATKYNVIIGQLLLEDNTVVKIMLSAVVTGMIGIYAMKAMGIAKLHPKPGSWVTAGIGGLIFGVGFAVLGYCPGTVAGAVGNGAMDALAGGVVGIIIGAGLFAGVYAKLLPFLNKGSFKKLTLPELLNVNEWIVIMPVVAVIVLLLVLLERAGL
ncbi:MAG: YeeE/YedE thiosulfate transporter family protein [bacterium]